MTTDPRKLAQREAKKPKPRRVYKFVTVAEEASRFRVLLDGKPVHSPLRNLLETSSRALADALAAEWDAQNPYIDPEAMPLTRLMATAVDKVVPQRAEIITALLGYIHADTLTYRAQDPPRLQKRQAEQWQPVVEWLDQELGIKLRSTEGILPLSQPEAVVTRFKTLAEGFDDVSLTAFQAAAATTSSLALALALVVGRLDASQVHAAALLDEIFQAEEWGEDASAAQRRTLIAAEIAAIARYLKLARDVKN